MPSHYAKDIKIIPCNMEKFLIFTLDNLKFLDSYQFLNTSLRELLSNLQNSGHDFKIFNDFFKKWNFASSFFKKKEFFHIPF